MQIQLLQLFPFLLMCVSRIIYYFEENAINSLLLLLLFIIIIHLLLLIINSFLFFFFFFSFFFILSYFIFTAWCYLPFHNKTCVRRSTSADVLNAVYSRQYLTTW